MYAARMYAVRMYVGSEFRYLRHLRLSTSSVLRLSTSSVLAQYYDYRIEVKSIEKRET